MRLLVVLGLCVGTLVAQDAKPGAAGREWQALLARKNVAAARALCTGWETKGTPEQKLEAEKCLTDIILRGAPVVPKRDAPRYTEATANEALTHIVMGLALQPADMTLNLGRLLVLGDMHRYDAMSAAFDETLKAIPDNESTPYWQQFIGDEVAHGNMRGGLVVAEGLYKHDPTSHEAAGNVGSLHDAMNEWDKGLPFLRKAVELAPTDAIDTWNLGLALDHVGELDEADKWLATSLTLPSDVASLKGRQCLYGRFEAMKRKETAKGCALVRSACPVAGRPTACVAAPKKSGAKR